MPKPTHVPRTNQQMLREIMSFSRFGPLAEVFVMEAVVKYADEVAAATPDQVEGGGLINGSAWIGVAKEIKTKLDAHYGRGDEQQQAAA